MKQSQALSGLGLDLTERQRKALLSTIEGDLTAEAARTAAEELGFIQPAPAAPASQEAAALARMSEASTGSADQGAEDPIAALDRADREGGKEALLAQISKMGGRVV